MTTGVFAPDGSVKTDDVVLVVSAETTVVTGGMAGDTMR
jgi:hypothetical protein